MTREQEQRVSKGAHVVYRGFPMVVVGTAYRIPLTGIYQQHLPRALDLAWREHPDRVIYSGVLARFCKLDAADAPAHRQEGQ